MKQIYQKKDFQREIFLFAISALLSLPITASAFVQSSQSKSPNIKTKGTLIYLADNLNEEANLGWCIDTVGRGFGEELHTHSCKPRGGDVQFSYSSQAGRIESVAFQGKCMDYNNLENLSRPFGLLDCVDGKVSQKFIYETNTMEIRLAKDPSKCVVVGKDIRNAGPFQSRDLILEICSKASAAFKQWVVRD